MRAKGIFIKALIGIGILAACQPKGPDLKTHLDGWESLTTFQVSPSKSIIVSDKRAKIIQGSNNVLVVELQRKPILKRETDKLSDVHTARRLVIELNPQDTFVTPGKLHQSKIYREILAMSPRYGVNLLKSNEKITIEKIMLNRWKVTADLEDFKFDWEISFADSSKITSRHKELLNDE